MDSMLLSILCVFGLIGGSLAQPAVTALICYPPPTVANAVYAPVQQVYQVGTTIRFTCRAGFRFTPTSSETAQCRSLAGRPTTWRLESQKTAPVCVLISPTRPVNPVVPVNPVAPVPRCQGRCPQLSECQRYNNVDICVCNDGYYNSNGVCTARTSDTLTTCRSPPCPPNSDPHLINGKYVHICKPTHFVFGNICAPRSTGRAQCSRPAVGPNVIIAADPGKTTWYSGETINYACSGQMIVTPSSRRQAVCGPTGLFSTPPPTCR
uniref:Sushi domain-containing protein n=1 Tax=Ciona savignyi TaxID=51511 RepID=H2ZF58_CIOSA